MASISRKSFNKVPIKNFQMSYLLGDEPIKINHFLWVGSWEVKMLWVRIMGVTLVYHTEDIIDVKNNNLYLNSQPVEVAILFT